MKILALDIGKTKIGTALSIANIFAKEYLLIENSDKQKSIKQIKFIINKEKIRKIVIGMPKNMDGTLSDISIYVKNFSEKLKKEISVPIFFEDERLTSQEAYNKLKKLNLSREEIKNQIDNYSAKIILEQYLNKKG